MHSHDSDVACAGMGAVAPEHFATSAGATVVPTETTLGGLPSPNGTPTAGSARRSMFGPHPQRVSGTKLREQIREEMFDPEKETNVLCSCF